MMAVNSDASYYCQGNRGAHIERAQTFPSMDGKAACVNSPNFHNSVGGENGGWWESSKSQPHYLLVSSKHNLTPEILPLMGTKSSSNPVCMGMQSINYYCIGLIFLNLLFSIMESKVVHLSRHWPEQGMLSFSKVVASYTFRPPLSTTQEQTWISNQQINRGIFLRDILFCSPILGRFS